MKVQLLGGQIINFSLFRLEILRMIHWTFFIVVELSFVDWSFFVSFFSTSVDPVTGPWRRSWSNAASPSPCSPTTPAATWSRAISESTLTAPSWPAKTASRTHAATCPASGSAGWPRPPAEPPSSWTRCSAPRTKPRRHRRSSAPPPSSSTRSSGRINCARPAPASRRTWTNWSRSAKSPVAKMDWECHLTSFLLFCYRPFSSRLSYLSLSIYFIIKLKSRRPSILTWCLCLSFMVLSLLIFSPVRTFQFCRHFSVWFFTRLFAISYTCELYIHLFLCVLFQPLSSN